MSVTIKAQFTKTDTSTGSYTSEKMVDLLNRYYSLGKITQLPIKQTSKDGLVESSITIFANQNSYDEFRKEDIDKENKINRDTWCKANNVSCTVKTI